MCKQKIFPKGWILGYFIIYYFLFTLLGFSIIYSQSKPDSTYYPLNMENKWIYKTIPEGIESTRYIVSDTIMKNNKRYFYFNSDKPNKQYERVDSSGKTWLYDIDDWDHDTATTELLMEDFSLPDGQIFKSNRFGYTGSENAQISHVTRVSELTGELTSIVSIKYFIPNDWPLYISFEKGIGIIWESQEVVYFKLISAVINGIKHITSVKDDKSNNETNTVLALSQNYPNPFNSSTMINYSVPKRSKIHISIYDLIGREVNRFDLGIKEPGNYSLNLNANHLTSGMYFCRIVSDKNFKMIKITLIK
jgi:hypothetical protein